MSRPADALRTALAGRAQVTAAPGCITWELVPEPPPSSLTDPVRGQPGTRLEFRAPDGRLIAAQHRTATMFTWWEGLPDSEHGPDESRPVRALAAFGRVSAAPGEAAEVRLRIPARAFARYDEHAGAGQNTDAGTATGGWVWPRGEYTVEVGRSSRDLPLLVPVTRI